MKKKRMLLIVSSLIIITTAILLNLYSNGGICMGEKEKKVDYMKVEFFKTQDTEKSIGAAEWKDSKVIINVTDPELEKILKSDFITTKSVEEGDKHILCRVELKPGTLEHLQAVALEAPDYIGIISYGEKINPRTSVKPRK